MFKRKNRWQKLATEATSKPGVAAGVAAAAGAAALTLASAAVSSLRRRSSGS